MKPRCPTCKKPLAEPHPETFPFCGSRCKLADLGSWLSGAYVVSRPVFDEDNPMQEELDVELPN